MDTLEFVCYYSKHMSVMFPNDIGITLVKTASDFISHTKHRHIIWLLVKLVYNRNDPTALHFLDLLPAAFHS